MNALAHPLMVWGSGLVVVAYAVLALRLLNQGPFRQPLDRAGVAVFFAAVLTLGWGVLGLLAARSPVWWPVATLADIGRYAAWFVFFVFLFRGAKPRDEAGLGAWLAPLAVALPVLALITLLFSLVWARGDGQSPTLLFLTLMALPLLGLVLVEQLFRNLPEDALWNAKPISLGLAGMFLYDFYLFSQAVLFNGIDPDALSIRGIVHAALMPLLLLSTTRHRNWIAKIKLSRKVVFHSAALLMAGAYLLFIAGVGYYVRYFGSEWGRALQLALIFLALVGLVAFALSGSFRARLRVMLGKHFFRYRYDYRDEWLRFTQTLSAQMGPKDMGPQVIRGLADMLESPAGALWLRRPDEAVYRQAGLWNLPPVAQAEPADSELMAFMQRTGWVVNLEEYERAPERYEQLALPAWLSGQTQAGVAGLCGAGPPAYPHGCELGGDRPAQDRRAAGGEFPGADAVHRGAAGGAQVSGVQSHVGVCGARPQKHRDPALPDGEKRQAPGAQPGVSGRHADDGGKLAGCAKGLRPVVARWGWT